MSAIHNLNPKAEHARRGQALEINISAAEAIMEVIKTNFGPTGTLKMMIGGAGDIKITKDGAVLLDELPIQHPTIALIQRTSVAVDDICGDGTTQCVILIGELLRQARRWLQEGVHPRVLVDGFQLAKESCLALLEQNKLTLQNDDQLFQAARTCLMTKLKPTLADKMAEISVKSVKIAAKTATEKRMIDLHMIEIMAMQHHSDLDTSLIEGIVMDHGWRHQELKCSRFDKCYTLTLNVSLEYEKAEVNNEYFYKSAEEKVAQAEKEREFVNKRVQKIIDLKKEICQEGETIAVFNQKGIDPESLQMLAEHNILALRRVKRRNMERLTLCCGGECLNTIDILTKEMCGYAESIYEELLGEDKFTFVTGVRDPKSCTILVKGPNKHTIFQIKDAIRDGLRSVKNTMVDGVFVGGAGNFEVQCYNQLIKLSELTKGKARMGVIAFADAMLGIPKCLAKNSGFDPQDSVFKISAQLKENVNVGLNIKTGEPVDVVEKGILDSYRVKVQVLQSASVIATQMLLVDEILKAGRAVTGGAEAEPDME
uniref:TCP-1 chaperonin subunit zeta n=1 Tax=Trepomonas sp. PC1 TaxID=1076344 RepID=A0A146K6D5_9EUKA|eukprot:JAP92187.1 TCP-1 chaperonin subunit zeta [Trepomonas sp. PC1]